MTPEAREETKRCLTAKLRQYANMSGLRANDETIERCAELLILDHETASGARRSRLLRDQLIERGAPAAHEP